MVRVVIVRRCKPDKEQELQKLLIQLRGTVLKWHAYLSGEVYRNTEDPSLSVSLSSWLTLDGWEAWKASSERQEILNRMEPLMVGPERTYILEPVL